MGNGSSQFGSVQSILQELRSLESQLNSINTVQRRQVLALQQQLAGRTVAWRDDAGTNGIAPCDPTSVELGDGKPRVFLFGMEAETGAARVLVGPVIGKVTDTTARILLEVDKVAQITCHVSMVDRHCPDGRAVASVGLAVEARRPAVFHFKNLVQGTTYRVVFSGLVHEHTLACVGQFRTLSPVSSVRMLAVSLDVPTELLPGEANPWEAIASRVANESVDLMLHLGGQVDTSSAFRESALLLQRHEERARMSAGQRSKLEDAICERFRDSYRFAWNLPHTREVLARCPHLMIWTDLDVYEGFTFTSDVQGLTLRPTLLRLAQRVYREYQRALWDDSPANEEMVWGKDGSGNEEKHFHVFGDLGVLFLDTRGSFVLPDGTQLPDAPFISETQWEFISKAFALEYLTRLVVVSDRPVVDFSHEAAQKCAQVSRNKAICEHWSFHADDQARLLKLLLSWQCPSPSVSAGVARECIVLAGGSRIGFETKISLVSGPSKPEGSGLPVLRQVVVGPVSASCKSFKLALKGKIVDHGDIAGVDLSQPTTYEYKHAPLFPQRSFACADVMFASGGENGEPHSIRVQLVGAQGCGRPPIARALIGPVIGKVTSSAAVILLEIDREARVSCVLTETISRREHIMVKVLPARRPARFYFSSLRPERRYTVRFDGIINASDRRGLVTTMPRGEDIGKQTLSFIVTGSDRPQEQSAHKKTLWKDLLQLVGPLWGGPQCLIHVGGQVSLITAIQKVRLVIGRCSVATDPSTLPFPEYDTVLSEVAEIFREAYRFAWNLPFTREVFARCPNLMIWNEDDIGGLLHRGSHTQDIMMDEHEVRWTPILVKIARKVFREYQRQLWDPEDLVSSECDVESDSGVAENHFHRWGHLGVFMLDLLGNSMNVDGTLRDDQPLLSIKQWSQLESLLRNESELSLLIIVSEFPVVDDSPADAQRKVLHPLRVFLRNRWPFHEAECVHLLELIFAWKAAVVGRDVLLVTGSDVCGIKTTIVDTAYEQAERSGGGVTMHDEIRQLAVGPITGRTSAFDSEKSGYLGTGTVAKTSRFTYDHVVSTGNGNVFGYVRVQSRKVQVKSDPLLGDLTDNPTEISDATVPALSTTTLTKANSKLVSCGGHKELGLSEEMFTMPLWLSRTLEDVEKSKRAREESRKKDLDDKAKDRELRELEKEIEVTLAKDGNSAVSKGGDSAEGERFMGILSETTSADGNPSTSPVMSEAALAADAPNVTKAKAVVELPGFESGIKQVYRRYSEENVGVDPDDFLLVMKNFFFREAPEDSREVFPHPQDATSTETLLELIVRFVLGQREQLADRTGGTRAAPIALTEALALAKQVWISVALLGSEASDSIA